MGRLALLGALAGLLVGCAPGDETGEQEAAAIEVGAAAAFPDTLQIPLPGLHPEGVEWDGGRGRFLVGSVTRGVITAVELDGSHDPFVEDGEISASIGIHIDDANGRLLVANSIVEAVFDPSNPGQARVGIYDLATGERIEMVDLGGLRPEGRHFANDLTSLPDGTIYITDSLSPLIYRVTPAGEASVLVEDERLAGERVGVNGIDWHPDGYLLVANMGQATLLRVPLEAPEELVEVRLPEPISGDGLFLAPDGTLVVVGSTPGPEGASRSEVLWLRSEDGWSSAEIVARAESGGATTGVVVDGVAYVVNPHFEALGGSEPHPSFEIYRVEPAGGT